MWSKAWSLLGRATVDKKHAFATPTLATVTQPAGDAPQSVAPRLRTVVLRKVSLDRRTLLAYTDARSQKVDDVRRFSPYTSWCFWDKRSQLQVVCTGLTTIADSKESAQRFDELPKHSRKAYATLSKPGHPVDTARDGLPEDWEQLTVEQTAYARDNFTLLRTEVTLVEILSLSRDGHRRLRAEYDDVGSTWVFSWIVP